MVENLRPEVIASTTPAMANLLLASLARLTKEDLQAAIERNSVYRETNAVHWATVAAHRARELFPFLKDE